MAYFRGLKTASLYLVALLALFAYSNAHAGFCSGTHNDGTQYAAQEHAKSVADNAGGTWNGPFLQSSNYYQSLCDAGTYSVHQFSGAAIACASPNQIRPDGTCGPVLPPPPTDAECLARPISFTVFQMWTGSIVCSAGCELSVYSNGSGGEVALTPTGACVDNADYNFDGCPVGYTDRNEMVGVTTHGSLMIECVPDNSDIDGDGIENSDDPSPDESGDQEPTDTDSDGIPDAKDFAPDDPDNGKELKDGETKATSDGGGNCDTPPSTKGDAVGAQVAYQTWATRCAVERLKDVTVSQGTSAGGLSAGDSTTLTAIKTNGTATNSKLDSIIGNTGGTAAAVASLQVEDTSTPGAGRGDDGQPASGAAAGHGEETEYGAGGLDQTGMGLGSTCPVMPAIDVGGYQITPDTGLMCDFLTACGALVFLFASIGALRILGSPV